MFKKVIVSALVAVSVAVAFEARAQAARALPQSETQTIAQAVAAPDATQNIAVADVQDNAPAMVADAASAPAMVADATPAQVQVPAPAPAPDMASAAPVKLTRRQKYDRGLAFDTQTPSMPKGLWVAGVNFGYSQHNNDAFRMLIVSEMNSSGHAFNISPMVHYVFANNQSIGVRFDYRRNLLQIDKLAFTFTPTLNEMLFPDGYLKYRFQSHSYMAYFSYRYYVGFGAAAKRLLFFNEVQLGFGGGQQTEKAGEPVNDGEQYKIGTFQNSFNFRVGLAPGVAFFVTNVMSIEVQIGLLGYNYQKMTQWGTNLEHATRNTHNVSTRFDFLSIAFGTTFYL
jgi:hypothetical protein